jgi:tetratricopeptide (TPR) repeat protein
MGDAYTQLGEYAKAEVYLKRAKAINPDFPGKPSKESLKKTETKL